MEPSDEWASEFGNDYHARNWVNWTLRVPFWKTIIQVTSARSVLELGCGPGWNLSAIKRSYPDVSTEGVEINKEARYIAMAAGIDMAMTLDQVDAAELCFTAGCLIHIPPTEIRGVMQEMIDSSFKYVLSVEYEAVETEEIEYRGQSGLLWKRPYGAMYEELGLKEIGFGKVGAEDGFDDCIWRLMSK